MWGHAWCHQKCIYCFFKVFAWIFSLELKKNILSHPVTSKQPPEIVQIHMRHPVNTIQTTFFITDVSKKNNRHLAIWVKSIFVMLKDASFQGYFTEVSFDTSVENQVSFLQNGCFFKSLWSFHEPLNQVKCR